MYRQKLVIYDVIIVILPGLELPTFDMVRDRPEANWLQKEMKDFMRQTLKDSNKEYSILKKKILEGKIKYNIKKSMPNTQKVTDDILKNLKHSQENIPYVVNDAIIDLKNRYPDGKIPKELRWILSDKKKSFFRINKGDQITVKAMNDKNPESMGNEIWILGAFIDYNWYNATELFSEGWLDRSICKGWRNYDVPEYMGQIISGIIPHGKKRILVMEKNRWRGLVNIQLDSTMFNIDCFCNQDDELLYFNLP